MTATWRKNLWMIGWLAAVVGLAATAVAADKPATKPVAKPAAPMTVPANPFAGCPPTVQLPTMPPSPAAAPRFHSLGTIAVTPRDICVVHLLGGETATRSSQRFYLTAASEELTNREWRISLREASKETGGVPIATILLGDGKLQFAWSPDASEQPQAGQLCNCVLKLSLGKGQHAMALRKPQRAPAIPLNLDDDVSVSWELPLAPPSNHVKLEFSLPKDKDKSFPRSRFVGKATLTASDDTTWVEFGLKKNEQGLRLKIETSFARNLQVRVTPFFQLATETKMSRLSSGALNKSEASVKSTIAALDARLKAIPNDNQKKSNNKNKKGDKTPDANDVLRSQVQKQLALARSTLDQIQALESMKKLLEGKGKIDVRVFCTADDRLVEMILANAPVATAAK